MPSLSDTRRLILILPILATAKGALTTQEILAKLPKKYRTHVRSLQRDLKHLAKWAPIFVDRGEKPYRWVVDRGSVCPCCKRRLSG